MLPDLVCSTAPTATLSTRPDSFNWALAFTSKEWCDSTGNAAASAAAFLFALSAAGFSVSGIFFWQRRRLRRILHRRERGKMNGMSKTISMIGAFLALCMASLAQDDAYYK